MSAVRSNYKLKNGTFYDNNNSKSIVLDMVSSNNSGKNEVDVSVTRERLKDGVVLSKVKISNGTIHKKQ